MLANDRSVVVSECVKGDGQPLATSLVECEMCRSSVLGWSIDECGGGSECMEGRRDRAELSTVSLLVTGPERDRVCTVVGALSSVVLIDSRHRLVRPVRRAWTV